MLGVLNCGSCGAPLPVGARFCPNCSAAVAVVARSDERKIATVVFADLVGSTQWGDQDPERARLQLASFYDAMREEIEAHGGTVEKFIGDAVMAVFGAPSALEDHPTRALRAALAMQERMTHLFDGRLGLRVGVNSGELVVGQPREGSSFVTGDPVNVAARLEQAASSGEILVGERTVATAGQEFRFTHPEIVAAKGKPDGVPARRLVRAAASVNRAPSRLPRDVEPVGRRSEIEALNAAYQDTSRAGRPSHVVVIGEPGVGKTTLVQALFAGLSELPVSLTAPVLRTGRCLAYGRGITYWPFGEVLRQQFDLVEDDPPELVRERLGERTTLGLTVGFAIGEDLHPFAAKERLHQAWVALVQEMTATGPVVLWIEDVHWAEDLLFELVDRLVSDVAGPLLVVTTARPELAECHPSWVTGYGRSDRRLMWLEALADGEAEVLLQRLGGSDLPEALRRHVLERAEGNPFFLEEIVQALVEPRDGTATIPDSVQALLAARIDALPDTAKSTLQVAAVVGRVFWGGLVAELLGEGHPELRVLEEREFIQSHGSSALGGEREYSFKHALSRQVAYESISKARRAHLHAAVAEWMERNEAGRDEQVPLVAYHYAEAVAPADVDLAWSGDDQRYEHLTDKAVHWLLRAAGRAAAQYSLNDAISLLDRALDLEPPVEVKVSVLSELGRVYALKYDGEKFWTAMIQAADLTGDADIRAELFAEMAFEVSARWGMFTTMPTPDLVDGWTAQALELAAPGSRARARALVAHCYWHPLGSRPQADEAWAIAGQLPDVELRSHAANACAFAAFADADFGGSRAWAEHRLSFADQVSDPDLLADTYGGVIPGCLGRGQFDDARGFAKMHDDVASQLSTHHQVHAVAYLLELEELAESWDTIRGLRWRAEETARANLDTPCVRNARSLLVCALAESSLGDDSESRRLEALAESMAMRGAAGTYAPLYLRLAMQRGDLESVSRWVDLAVAPPPAKNWWALTTAAARLDALSALSRWDRIEAEAPGWATTGTYLEPFALRALGLAREDPSMLERAKDGFAALGLQAQAERTGHPGG